MGIGIGILGFGRIVRLAHLRVLAGIPGVRVVAIADSDPASREHAAREAPEAHVLSDAHELLALPDLDAVVIALPTLAHREAAVAAFERGLHVYDAASRCLTIEVAQEGVVQGVVALPHRWEGGNA